MDYVSQTDIETYLNIKLTANGVALFTLLKDPMRDLVDQYCNRSWNLTNPIIETFDALSVNGKITMANYEFFPKYIPISKTVADVNYPLAQGIIYVKIGGANGNLLDMNYVVNYGTHVRFSASFPSVILANPLGFKMVEIKYNSDAAGAVPRPVKVALVQWMARTIQESPDAGKEVTRVQAGTVQAQYAQDKLGGIPNFVKLVLDMYRIPSQDVF